MKASGDGPPEQAASSFTAMVLEPSHPNAALPFARRQPRLGDEVHVFSRGGPGLRNFESMLAHFNERDTAPTNWQLVVHRDGPPLEHLLEVRPGDFAVVAGRYDDTLARVAALHRAGVPALANQPWLVAEPGLPRLRQVTSGAPLSMEMTPARFDALATLRQRIVRSESLFGGLESRDSEGPAIEIGALYHLHRSVGERVIRRPAWHFDPTVSGDGIAGGLAHLVDKVQSLVGADRLRRFDSDANLLRARRWRTEVPLDVYRQSTGELEFPEAVLGDVHADVLSLDCNARLDFTLDEVTARTRVEWRVTEPEYGGSLRHEIVRGRRADLVLRQNRSSEFQPQLLYRPKHARELPQLLDDALAAWQAEFPGAKAVATPAGIEVSAGERTNEGLEHALAAVMADYLERLSAAEWPADRLSAVRLRYRLLVEAGAAAVDGLGDESSLD